MEKKDNVVNKRALVKKLIKQDIPGESEDELIAWLFTDTHARAFSYSLIIFKI